MRKIVEKRQLSKHKSEDLYGLVLDVEKYQEFIPWCYKSRVAKVEQNRDVLYCDLWIGNGLFIKKFTSRVTHRKKNSTYLLFAKTDPLKGLKVVGGLPSYLPQKAVIQSI